MATWTPDQSFYPSPRMAMKAAPETLAYVAAFDPDRKVPDAIAVVDVDPGSSSYSKIVGTTEMPNAGDELHHFGWNACSSCLCPNAPHPHVERRYLVVPGLRSSRIHILDTKPDPRKPSIVKVIEPAEVAERAGYTRPHTVHCGPEGIYVAALGNREGKGPGGVFMMDHESFDVRGQWEMDRGPQYFAYDAWWHLGHDTMVTSEWGTPDTFEGGLIPEVLLGAKYGRRLHFWDLHKRKHLQTIDFGDKYQLVFELRPAHDPTKAYGFVNCVISLENLSSSIWTWYRDGDKWAVKKIIEIPAEPADPDLLPPVLKGFNFACGTSFRQRSAQRRPADGRDQPRRQARLLHQLALRRHRFAILSGRHRGLDGEARRSAFGRHRLRPEVLRQVAQVSPPAPGAPRGRRLLVGFVLLSVIAPKAQFVRLEPAGRIVPCVACCLDSAFPIRWNRERFHLIGSRLRPVPREGNE